MSKPYLRVELFTQTEQSVVIQEGEDSGYIEVYFKEEGVKNSGLLYISKTDLPTIIEKLQEVMNYTEK